MPFLPEPPFTHGKPPVNKASTAVLLCNLGTPDAPTTSAVRRFLREFLSDHRVVEIPKPIWWLILNAFILPFRPSKSAAKYASIWMTQGSPLRYWTHKQATLLEGWLGEAGHRVTVRHAMRYGSTSIPEQLNQLKADGVSRVLILSAYPQYSATTTASVLDAVYNCAGHVRSVPELRFANHYHDDAGYSSALEQSVHQYWQVNGKPNFEQGDQLVMSFHGITERSRTLGDPYFCECMKTARLLGEALQLMPSQYKVTFQSRLGRAKWLQPYTEPTLIEMAKAGVQRVDVICPGFNCDGLETLKEINMEARHAFTVSGGKYFHYIPCLNDNPAWISALSSITQKHLSGWPTQAADAAALQITQDEAMKAGAKQ